MSAIAAEFASHGGYDSLASVSTMLLRMRFRGPDGARAVRVGAPFARGAIGYASMIIAPEEVGVDQPLTLPTGTVIAFHGRLHNRAELLAELDLEADARSDAHIVASLYDRCGSHTPKRMVGDFAFVISSLRNGEVFAARDPMGVTPIFFWWSRDGRLRIATDKSALFADGAFRPKVNRAETALALVDEHIERDETVYEGIRAIPPGSTLLWRGHAPIIDRYFRVDPWKRTRVANADEAAAMLRHTLTEAVRCRMRTIGPVASTVSGGLDSSSIAAISARVAKGEGREPPVLVHARANSGPCNEIPFAQRVADHLGLPLHVFIPSEAPGTYPPRFDLDLWDDAAQVWHDGMAKYVRPTGARVYFLGWGSDELQRWTSREADQAAQDGKTLRAAQWSGLFDNPLSWSPWRNFLGVIKRRFHVRGPRIGAQPMLPAWLTSEAAGLIEEGLSRRRLETAEYRRAGAAREVSLAGLTHAVPLLVLQQTAHGAARVGLEASYPFYDTRVVELLVSLPSEVTSNWDLAKPLLRRAIEPLLPPCIVYRTVGGDFSLYYQEVLRREAPLYRPLFSDSRLEAAGLVNPRSLLTLLDNFLANPNDCFGEVTSCLVVEAWLRAVERHRPEPLYEPALTEVNEVGTNCTLW